MTTTIFYTLRNSLFTVCVSLYSPVVRVYRRCLSHRRWTSVDFSGCILASSEQKVLVILSLQANFTGSITSNISLEEQVKTKTHNNLIIPTFKNCVCAVKGDCPDKWWICSTDFVCHNTASDSGPVLTSSVEGVLHHSRTGVSRKTRQCILQLPQLHHWSDY